MSSLHPHYLRTEYKQNPLGIDSPNPRLSWLVELTLRTSFCLIFWETAVEQSSKYRQGPLNPPRAPQWWLKRLR